MFLFQISLSLFLEIILVNVRNTWLFLFLACLSKWTISFLPQITFLVIDWIIVKFCELVTFEYSCISFSDEKKWLSPCNKFSRLNWMPHCDATFIGNSKKTTAIFYFYRGIFKSPGLKSGILSNRFFYNLLLIPGSQE